MNNSGVISVVTYS